MSAIESFLEYLRYERNYSEKTVYAYGEDLRQFESFIERRSCNHSIGSAETGAVREWAMEMMDGGCKSATINRKLSALHTFYKFLLKRGVIDADPTVKVARPKNSKPLPVFVQEKEMDRLLDDVDFGDDFKGTRDRLIIEMFYETGMRLAELVGLDLKDVDFFSSTLKVTGKRDKQRVIPFYKELGKAMQRYMQRRDAEGMPGNEAFFVMQDGRRITRAEVYKVVRQSLALVSTVKKRSPHVLRHTFATAMLNHNAELGAIKEILGHESLQTTEIYTHTTFEELKKVYKQAHPRA